MSGMKSVPEILQEFLERQGLSEQLERQGVLEEWAEVVGKGIAAVTRARSISDSVLIVEVRSSAWLMELNFMKRDILDRLNANRSAGISRIVFVLAEKGDW